MNLSEIFKDLVGKDVTTVESASSRDLDTNCATVKEIFKRAKDKGLTVRPMYPDMMYAMDYCTTRLNVDLDKTGPKSYKITGFHIS